MGRSKNYSIYKGYNFRVLKVKGFDPICFGCPPGIVKDFARRDEALPSQYVLPVRTFVQGKNNFDFEFIVYTFLFCRPSNEKITVYCVDEQRVRFKAILRETVFGPTLRIMIRAQFYRFGRGAGFAKPEAERFLKFLDRLADSKKPFRLYNQLIKRDASQRQIQSEFRAYFEFHLRNKPWLKSKVNSRSRSRFAQNYIICAQLRKEMDLFAMAPEHNYDNFFNQLIDFKIFNRSNVVTLKSV